MTEAPDFRSDPSESHEGKGIAHGRRTTFWRSVPEKTLSALSAESPYSSTEEWPVFVRDHAAEAVVEDAELIGFWVAWHRAGGFQSLESGGWHRATIYRKIRRFRARFGDHPDEYRFSWITLDLERAWNKEIDEVLQPFTPLVSDRGIDVSALSPGSVPSVANLRMTPAPPERPPPVEPASGVDALYPSGRRSRPTSSPASSPTPQVASACSAVTPRTGSSTGS